LTEEIVPIDDLDVIYLSYDEPQKEEFWLKIKHMVPWATRVDGVKGSDNAHKAAAHASDTERFILIDGDIMVDPQFFEQSLIITPQNFNAQFRWRSRNVVNNLYYGNGGLSSWTKNFVLNMKTHENSDGRDETKIEFCFDGNYWPMHNCYSTTHPNYSPKQAWRAGFREGVKLCTRQGKVNRSAIDFLKWVWPKNLHNLRIWQSVGNDIENGWWAIHGARCGTHYAMLRDWDYTHVQDFDRLDQLWELHKNDDAQLTTTIKDELNKRLGLNIVDLDASQSSFVKEQINHQWKNKSIMTTEQEGLK
jgi:hypothetical protein